MRIIEKYSNQKLKIYQLIQKPQLRGAEIFASQLSSHLMALGQQCILITIFEGDGELPFHGEIVHLNRPLGKRLLDFVGWKQLADVIKKDNPDLIQANAGDTLKFAVFSKLFFRWKTPIVFRNANKMSDFIDSKPKFWFNKFLLNRVAYVISVSESCSEDLVTFFSLPKKKVDTVEIGIELHPIGHMPVDLVSIFNRGPVLIHVASMVPEKNHHGLLRIFKMVIAKMVDVQLLVIGKGKLEAELKHYAHQLGIENQVHFLGSRTDVMEIMKFSKALLLPSKIEGLPGVILEAMYAHCPVVAYRVGGIGEVIDHNQTGLLTTKDDEESFAELVTTLLTNEELRKKLTLSGSHFAASKFDNRMIAKRFLEIYKRI